LPGIKKHLSALPHLLSPRPFETRSKLVGNKGGRPINTRTDGNKPCLKRQLQPPRQTAELILNSFTLSVFYDIFYEVFRGFKQTKVTAVSPPLIIPASPTLVGDDPVFHCQIDDFLPDADYRLLRDSFPDNSWFDDLIEGNKKRINSRRSPEIFERFCATHPEWQRLFDGMRAAPFVNCCTS